MTIDTKQVRKRIHDYLATGGLFNPELANHDAVRDLIMDCADEIDQLRQKVNKLTAQRNRALGDADHFKQSAKGWIQISNAKSLSAQELEAKLEMVRCELTDIVSALIGETSLKNTGAPSPHDAAVRRCVSSLLKIIDGTGKRVPELEKSNESKTHSSPGASST